jgi:paraquat-inducible protein A
MVALSSVVACEYCDLLHDERPLAAREKALCVRCGGILYRDQPDTIRRTFALNLAALALLAVANVYPFLSFNLEGQTAVNRIVTGVILLWNAGYPPLALLILWASVVAPAAMVLSGLYVTGPLLRGRVPKHLARVTRLHVKLAPWAMLEIYLLAVFATLVKLASMATIVPEVGAYAFGALILVSAAAKAAFDPRVVWERLEASR